MLAIILFIASLTVYSPSSFILARPTLSQRNAVLIEVVNESAAKAHGKWRSTSPASFASLPTPTPNIVPVLAAFYGDQTYTTSSVKQTQPTGWISSLSVSNLTLTAEQQVWVDVHNQARKLYGAGNVTWNDDLVPIAQANTLLCQHKHT
jgi:uncharacterized protein YkwD